MKHGRLRFRIPWTLVLTALLAQVFTATAAAEPKPLLGKIAGVVRDAGGTAQMGATVQLIREGPAAPPSQQYRTNPEGIFRGEKLVPGLYTIRVTLAGFLPTLEQHVRIAANLTTLVRIEMESMFASLDRLRRQPVATADAEDWKWVLRSAAAMRPVLQWTRDGTNPASYLVADTGMKRPHARLELTSGARRPGSVSNLAESAGSAFAYDEKLGGTNRLLLAGQMSYERAAAGGVATVWLPAGSLDAGPHTSLVVRQAKLGPDGLTFRGLRMEQGGTVALGDRVAVRYGAEYVLVGAGSAATSLRPRTEVDLRVNEDWRASMVFAAQPGAPYATDPSGEADAELPLVAALNELDGFPVLLWRAGRPVLEGGWHQEVRARRKLGTRGSLQVAAFHDDNRHVAVFGRNAQVSGTDFFHDFFSNAMVYDGGSSSSWGARAGAREKLSESVELTAMYTFGGALAPQESSTPTAFRDALRTEQRHALYAGVKTTVPKLGTQINGGYQWMSGVVVSLLDRYGESLFQADPYVHLSVRQPLPRRFAPGHWEALADCQNLLAQGYVPMSGHDGQVVFVPAFRSFRGGLSVQF